MRGVIGRDERGGYIGDQPNIVTEVMPCYFPAENSVGLY